jgi:hypothetical protein
MQPCGSSIRQRPTAWPLSYAAAAVEPAEAIAAYPQVISRGATACGEPRVMVLQDFALLLVVVSSTGEISGVTRLNYTSGLPLRSARLDAEGASLSPHGRSAPSG